MKGIILLISHALVAALGFAAGIYLLPVLTAPDAPTEAEMQAAQSQALYKGNFRRDLKGSDFLHWGEGDFSIGKQFITLKGEIAPGPDYKLYLSPSLVETEEEFKKIKSSMVQVGDVKTFENFILSVPNTIDPSKYKAVVIWCESFEEFITAGTYQ